ncbi:PhoX family protein [Pseudonocardia acaciae]|uniref:PhoX family protein n=1 Tax=Pseudonocardia acaciae TaxID=551276 RepID=UPI00048A54EF|nr:PhoX family phosphatase [Pseudonocardia acaciae]
MPPPHAGAGHLGRSAITCRYRCGAACAHPAPNTSANPTFLGLVNRRDVFRAGALLTLVGASGAALAACGGPEGGGSGGAPAGPPAPGTAFTPVAPNTADTVTVPAGYTSSVVVRWGDPILPGAPAFDFGKQTAAAQAGQFGFNNDFCGLVPLGPDRWAMWSNHEYVTPLAMFTGYDEKNPTEEQVKIGWNAVGGSVLVVHRTATGALEAVPGDRLNRRITALTPFRLTGPAAGSAPVRTGADPEGRTVLGTHSNCSGGVTPWGTILSGEENFHSLFANAASVTDPAAAARLTRYGVTTGESETKWERFDPRWDVGKEPNEVNRYGYIVEIDPLEPSSTPVKHTALGRFKHEGANIRLAPDGRAVAYMGDDERFDYLYKFVSRDRYDPNDRAKNKTLLESGTLYVATLTGASPPGTVDGGGAAPAGGFRGSGTWVPLAEGGTSKVPGMSVEEVLVFTRLAADKVGATKMDRPEDVQPHPSTGKVYVALTNNTDRGAAGKAGADEPNPRRGNKHGHILELAERGDDPTGTAFDWSLLLVCGDPAAPDTYFAGFDKKQVSPISCPDNLDFDAHGNLWIATDGNALKSNDGLFAVPLDGPERGHVKQFLTVPKGAETCGPVVTDRFVLVSVQHPGEVDGASADKPASHWPDGGTSLPRPAVVCVVRDGGAIGA